jgi:hypothetical protein
MPDDEAKQLKIESTTGVPRDPNWFDRSGLAGIISGVGLATYLVVVQFPKMVEAIDKLSGTIAANQVANEAHYRAISDDRRIQFDDIRGRIVDIAHDVTELRNDRRASVKPPEQPKAKGP